MRVIGATVAALLLVLAGTGCGGQLAKSRVGGATRTSSSTHGVQKLTRTDPAGDVNQLQPTTTSAPPYAALDLRKVVLRRDSRRLRVSLETAARPRGLMSATFVILGDRGVHDVTLEIDWQYNGGPQAQVWGPGLESRGIPVEMHGATATVSMPLNRLSRMRIFKWQAWTYAEGGGGEIADTVPSRPGSYGFFPTFPR